MNFLDLMFKVGILKSDCILLEEFGITTKALPSTLLLHWFHSGFY